jgi:EAL domain-containing protein (putative c-di-GMP-specific phosphodiesterase class I)
VTAGFVPAALPHMSIGARSSFVPRIDLTSGRIVGFLATLTELRPGRGTGEDGLEPFEDRIDREIADVLVAARAAGTSQATVHLPVAADAVAWAANRLRAVRPAMLHGAGRSAGVSLLLRPRVRSASTAALEQGIGQVRRDGFGVALSASGFAPPEIVRLAPDQLVLDPACLAGVEAGDPCALATLEAATTLARAGAAVLVADGVRDEALLREVRRRGAQIASGPILAADQPSALPAEATLAPGLWSRLRATEPEVEVAEPGPAGPDREVTLGDVARPATVVPDTATGDEVRTVLADDQDCAGVVLVDAEGRPTGYVDRNRFLLTIAGPYGRAVFAHRDAARLADAPTLRPTTTRVRDAVRERLDGDPARRYDDTVLTEPDGRTVRVARFADLVRALDPAGGPAPSGPANADLDPTAAATRRGRHRLVGLRPRAAGIAAG